MNLSRVAVTAAAVTLMSACSSLPTSGEDAEDMSFFITSENPGQGGNLAGLAGADAYCGALAATAGSVGKTWRAYLSTTDEDARDRIGSGPWVNAKGVVVAQDVDDLHSENNLLTKDNSLSESGDVVNGRGDEPNRHDIITGSDAQGRLSGDACADWTSADAGSAMVGHHDRTGGGDAPMSWNSAHPSRGCSLDALQSTGGDGLYYCFAE